MFSDIEPSLIVGQFRDIHVQSHLWSLGSFLVTDNAPAPRRRRCFIHETAVELEAIDVSIAETLLYAET